MKFNCCNKAWDMIRAAFDMASHSIRGIRLNTGTTIYRPDGAGTVDIPVLTQTDLDGKQNKLTAGIGIRIANDVITNDSRFTVQNNDGSVMFYKNGEKVGEITEGTNITISPEGVISATGGGSGGTSTASEVLLTDGRSVQEGIDALEDELGDLGTSGTVQERLEALEQADVELSKAYSGFNIGYGDNAILLEMTAVDGMTSATGDIILGGDGINIDENGVMSVDTSGFLRYIEDLQLGVLANLPVGAVVVGKSCAVGITEDPTYMTYFTMTKVFHGATNCYIGNAINLYSVKGGFDYYNVTFSIEHSSSSADMIVFGAKSDGTPIMNTYSLSDLSSGEECFYK